VAPPGELRVNAGVVCWQVKLCDPHLSALEVRFSRRGAVQIGHLFYIFLNVKIFVYVAEWRRDGFAGCRRAFHQPGDGLPTERSLDEGIHDVTTSRVDRPNCTAELSVLDC